MPLIIDKNTLLIFPEVLTAPLSHARAILMRDMKKVFGCEPRTDAGQGSTCIRIRYVKTGDTCAQQPESFALRFRDAPVNQIELIGADDLGIVYGVLYFTQQFLGVYPFWFWADLEPIMRETIAIPLVEYHSPVSYVKYRGWFINDEAPLLAWKGVYPPGDELWHPVFETLLRCGGNMVIPGTDLPRDGRQWALAAEMGLHLTHHHVEPLGAELFSRRYPGSTPSYREHPHLFEALWLEAVDRQKQNRVLWVLGHRGQGDRPFWEDDPTVNTPQERGAAISRVIHRQYEIVSSHVKEPVCCAYIYGEITELYRQGFIRLPPNTIKIWADNGYGKMVSRRIGADNSRTPALPSVEDRGPHGLYYHACFFDCLSSNHHTMLMAPEFMRTELTQAFHAGCNEYLIVNCGYIRPHLFSLDLLACLWNEGDVDIAAHRDQFCSRYFGGRKEIADALIAYFNAPIAFGAHDDEKCGDLFYHYPLYHIAQSWLQGCADTPNIHLAFGPGVAPFAQQVHWFSIKAREGLTRWQSLRAQYETLYRSLDGRDRQFFYDQLLLPAILHETGSRGLLSVCASYAAFEDKRIMEAFVLAVEALVAFREGAAAFGCAEHGKWQGFYRGNWIVNYETTLYIVESIVRYLRIRGDSVHLLWWPQRYVRESTGDRKVDAQPMDDILLARHLRTRFDGSQFPA